MTGARLQTSCSAFRKKSSDSSGRAACGALGICNLSMNSNCYRAQSSGSRILATGLLPLLRLRCSSCQGMPTLTRDKRRASHMYPSRCISRIGLPVGIQALLRPRPGLSHNVMNLINETDQGLVSKSLQMKRNAFLKSPASVSRAYTGAEGQQ